MNKIVHLFRSVLDWYRKPKIFKLAKKLGKDWDGDIIVYKKQKYYFNVSTDELSRIESNFDVNVFVIGSLTQSTQIKEIAKKYIHAKYVHSQPSKSFKQLVSEAFDNIEEADVIIALRKPDGSIGQGVTYEIEYAKRLNKKIIYVDSAVA